MRFNQNSVDSLVKLTLTSCPLSIERFMDHLKGETLAIPLKRNRRSSEQ